MAKSVRPVIAALASLLLIMLGTLGAAAIAEITLRIRHVTPTRQIVHGYNLHMVDGIPVWEDPFDWQNRECAQQHPERLRILFFGASITAGGSMAANERFTSILQERLNAARPEPGFCVMNFAQPGFRYKQLYAVASEELPRYRPALAMYQDWDIIWRGTGCQNALEYVMLGDSAYMLAGLHARRDGFPGLYGVPDTPNRMLFLHSRLYQYLTLAHGERARESYSYEKDTAVRERELLRFAKLARSAGSKPVFYIPPDLSYPLRETRDDVLRQEEPVIDFGRAHHFPVIRLRPELADQDNDAIRLDDWHFNAAGHRVVAKVFERIVLGLLDGSVPGAKKPMSPRK